MSKDWPVVRLGEVAEIVSGGTPSRGNPAYWGGDIPWVKTAEIKNRTISADDITERITAEGLKRSAARVVPAGTILMAMYGQGATRGRVSILGLDAAVNQACAGIMAKEGVSNNYLFYALRYRYETIRLLSNSGSQENLSSDILRSIALPLPPLNSQLRIAEVLGAWDAAVATASRLADLAECRLSAMGQLLLDERGHLWPETQLGKLGEISGSGIDKQSKIGEVPVVLVNYLDVVRHDEIRAAQLSHWVTAPSEKAVACAVRTGDILFTPSSEIRGDIAHSAVVAESIPSAVYSYHVVRLRPFEDLDPNFAACAFKSSDFYRQAYRMCEGSGQRYVLNLSTFRRMTIRIPTAGEQKRVGMAIKTARAAVGLQRRLQHRLEEEAQFVSQRMLGPVSVGDSR